MMEKGGCAVVPAAFARGETHKKWRRKLLKKRFVRIFRGWNEKMEGISGNLFLMTKKGRWKFFKGNF